MFFISFFCGKFGEISYDEFATFLEMGKKGGGGGLTAFVVHKQPGSLVGFKKGELFVLGADPTPTPAAGGPTFPDF